MYTTNNISQAVKQLSLLQLVNLSNQIQLCEHASYSYSASSWHQQTNSLWQKIFHWVENVIKQLAHMSAVCS